MEDKITEQDSKALISLIEDIEAEAGAAWGYVEIGWSKRFVREHVQNIINSTARILEALR